MASSPIERARPDESLIQLVASILGQASLRGTIIGGVARNHWEETRLTSDLDLTVAADRDAFLEAVAAFVERGYVVLREQERDRPSGPDFVQMYHPDSHYVVELQSAKTEFQALVLQRAVPIPGAEPLTVASREDLIVLKLIAYRRKDIPDLYDLSQNEGLDWDYIAHWAKVWAVEDRLAQLRSMES